MFGGPSRPDISIFFIILADNGSTDGSVDFIRRNYPEVELVVLQKNAGFCAANNIALEEIKTEYVALLNNDAVPHRCWLENVLEALEYHREVGFTESKMLFEGKPGNIDQAGDAYTAARAGCLHGRAGPASSYNKREWTFGD